jgi:hypothetical protein
MSWKKECEKSESGTKSAVKRDLNAIVIHKERQKAAIGNFMAFVVSFSATFPLLKVQWIILAYFLRKA